MCGQLCDLSASPPAKPQGSHKIGGWKTPYCRYGCFGEATNHCSGRESIYYSSHIQFLSYSLCSTNTKLQRSNTFMLYNIRIKQLFVQQHTFLYTALHSHQGHWGTRCTRVGSVIMNDCSFVLWLTRLEGEKTPDVGKVSRGIMSINPKHYRSFKCHAALSERNSMTSRKDVLFPSLSYTLKMDAVCLSETSTNFYQTMRLCLIQYGNSHHLENPTSCNLQTFIQDNRHGTNFGI
jgi:hypothetical protein